MKIYTKTGDAGETSLYGGKRVPKNSLRIDAYGTVDELNSVIGVCRSLNTVKELDLFFDELQRDLFTLGADLATPEERSTSPVLRIQESHIGRIEKNIDALESHLTPLKKFILPGGSRTSAMVHFARTVCRRAERIVVHLAQVEPSIGKNPVIYLNRLSDFLFVLARYRNSLSNFSETEWDPS